MDFDISFIKIGCKNGKFMLQMNSNGSGHIVGFVTSQSNLNKRHLLIILINFNKHFPYIQSFISFETNIM